MWTIAIVIGLVGVGILLSFLAKMFNEESVGIKTLLLMLGLLVTIVLSRVLSIIVDSNATGTMKTNLASLTQTVFFVSITLFSFFIAYFFIIYTIGVVNSMRNAKSKKERVW